VKIPWHSELDQSYKQLFGILLPDKFNDFKVTFLNKPSPMASAASLPNWHFDIANFLKSLLF
jgi:hypothetical protein